MRAVMHAPMHAPMHALTHATQTNLPQFAASFP